MQILSVLIVIGELLLQVLVIKEQNEINKWLRKCAKTGIDLRKPPKRTA